MTIAEPASAATDATTVATGDLSEPEERKPAGPGPATIIQGLMRAEIEEMDRGHWLSAVFNTLFVQVLALLLVIGGGVWWFWPRRLTAEEQFDRGVAALVKDAGPEWIVARKEYFEPLVASDPDAWSERVAPYLRQIELYELTRRTASGRRGKSAPPASEAERVLRLALHYRDIGDTERAERTLAALAALLEGDAAQSNTRDLAARLLEELQAQRASAGSDRDALLQDALRRANALWDEGDSDPIRREAARRVWRSLIELYGDDRAAAQWTAQARARLEANPEHVP